MSDLEAVSSQGADNAFEIGNIKRSLGDKSIHVSIDTTRFAEILEDIVGHRETLSKEINADYILDVDGMVQYNDILLHKINMESRVTLQLFTADISYNDNSKRTINTIDSLKRVFEQRSVDVAAVELKWEVLVDLGTEHALQRQTVKLLLSVGDKTNNYLGRFNLVIEHTNQLWAVEVMNIFVNQFEINRIKYNCVYNFINWARRSKKFIIMALFVIAGVVIFIYGLTGGFKRDYISPETKLLYHLSETVAETDSSKKQEMLSQFMLVLYLITNTNSDSKSYVLSFLKDGYVFNKEFMKVFKKYEEGEFNKYTIINTTSRKIGLASIVMLILTIIIGFAGDVYLKIFRIRSFILLTNGAEAAYVAVKQFRSTLWQFIYGVFASLVAALCVYGIELLSRLGGTVISP